MIVKRPVSGSRTILAWLRLIDRWLMTMSFSSVRPMIICGLVSWNSRPAKFDDRTTTRAGATELVTGIADAIARAPGSVSARAIAADGAIGAVERAGLDAIELAQRSVGLSGFLEAHPLERLARDLATYLRQPAPDGALAGAATYVAESEAPVHALWHDSEPA